MKFYHLIRMYHQPIKQIKIKPIQKSIQGRAAASMIKLQYNLKIRTSNFKWLKILLGDNNCQNRNNRNLI